MANNIVDKFIESALDSIFEEMSKRSPLKPQATETLSPTLWDVGTLTEFSSILKGCNLRMKKMLQTFPPTTQWDRVAMENVN